MHCLKNIFRSCEITYQPSLLGITNLLFSTVSPTQLWSPFPEILRNPLSTQIRRHRGYDKKQTQPLAAVLAATSSWLRPGFDRLALALTSSKSPDLTLN